ncbi:MAG: hypothetical protein ACRYFS_20020 [Janthinobacterium lividum]
MRNKIITIILLLIFSESLRANAQLPEASVNLDHEATVTYDLATLDFSKLLVNGNTLFVVSVLPDSNSGGEIDLSGWIDSATGERHPIPGGTDVIHFSGNAKVDYTTHKELKQHSFRYSFDIPVSRIQHHSSQNEEGNYESLLKGGELVYTGAGSDPVFHNVPMGYLIPSEYVKFVPEVVTILQDQSKQFNSTLGSENIYRSYLSSSNPFLRILAFRFLINGSTPNDKIVNAVLTSTSYVEASLTALGLAAPMRTNSFVGHALALDVVQRPDVNRNAFIALGCYVSSQIHIPLGVEASKLLNQIELETGPSIPETKSSHLLSLILSATKPMRRN